MYARARDEGDGGRVRARGETVRAIINDDASPSEDRHRAMTRVIHRRASDARFFMRRTRRDVSRSDASCLKTRVETRAWGQIVGIIIR